MKFNYNINNVYLNIIDIKRKLTYHFVFKLQFCYNFKIKPIKNITPSH